VGEQEFFLTKGLQHAPQRCENCRKAMQAAASRQLGSRGSDAGARAGGYPREFRNSGDGDGKWARRQMTEIRCVQCGEVTMVPFQPRGDRPVYCKSCYAQARGIQGSEFR
jgi:CxxC-x17-CxxC domain-containing protein